MSILFPGRQGRRAAVAVAAVAVAAVAMAMAMAMEAEPVVELGAIQERWRGWMLKAEVGNLARRQWPTCVCVWCSVVWVKE